MLNNYLKEETKTKTIEEFNKWAETFDRGIWSLYFRYCSRKVIEIVKPYLEIQQNCRILDLGCGTGNLTISLSHLKSVEKIVGIDISEKMIEVARRKTKNLLTEKKTSFLIGMASKLPFNDNYFHMVFSLNCFHHYYDALEEIIRVLKPGGLFIIVDNYSDNFLRKIWIKFLTSYFKEKWVKYYSKKELNTLLALHKFDILAQRTLLYFILITICAKTTSSY